jgi:predicted transcriptional regulator
VVKTAISLPDELFREIDARAKALNVSRSALLARAAREFLASHRPAKDATAAWNRAIDRGGQPGEEPAATLARKRTKAVIRSRRSREKGG